MERKYIKEIIKILWQIDSEEVLNKIYTVAKTHLDILREKGVQHNGKEKREHEPCNGDYL